MILEWTESKRILISFVIAQKSGNFRSLQILDQCYKLCSELPTSVWSFSLNHRGVAKDFRQNLPVAVASSKQWRYLHVDLSLFENCVLLLVTIFKIPIHWWKRSFLCLPSLLLSVKKNIDRWTLSLSSFHWLYYFHIIPWRCLELIVLSTFLYTWPMIHSRRSWFNCWFVCLTTERPATV